MGCGERTAEGGACLAIAHVTIGEEDGSRCGEAIAQLASLADEAILYLHAVDDAGTFGDNRVLGDNACSDIDIAMDGTQ